MSKKFRKVYTAFWEDPTVGEEMSPEDKYFFLYLLTNSNTTPIGIYEITRRQMAFDLGYSIDTVNALLDRFIHHFEMVRYNKKTRELAIKNWGRYNLNRTGKPMIDCMTSHLKRVKDKSLIRYVGKRIENPTIKALFEAYSNDEIDEVEELSTKDVSEEAKTKVQDTLPLEVVEKNEVRELFDHYVSKNIINHKRLTPAMRRAIKARLRDYTFDELKQAIDNYASVFHSELHWFTHKYPLADFMRDKDIRKFLDEADPLDNFAIKQGPPNRFGEVRKEDFDLS